MDTILKERYKKAISLRLQKYVKFVEEEGNLPKYVITDTDCDYLAAECLREISDVDFYHQVEKDFEMSSSYQEECGE